MTERNEIHDQGMTRGEQVKSRILFVGGSLIAALGALALAAGEFRRGTTSLVIGIAALVLAVRRAQALTASTASAHTDGAAFTPWYTAALGLALMGGGAAATTFARRADTTATEVILFLVAGVLLWAGVTCLVAAALATRRRQRAGAKAKPEGAT